MDNVFEESKMPLYCVVTCNEKCISEIYQYGFFVSTIISIVTTMISLYNIIMHYINFNNPFYQSKIIILLFLPIIFSITAIFSFYSFKLNIYMTAGRTVYEIFALLAFIYLMYGFIGFDIRQDYFDERKVYEVMRSQSSQIPPGFPCTYFQKPYQISSWRKAKYFSHRVKRSMLQFLIAKILASLLFLVFEKVSDWDYTIPEYVITILYWVTTISSYVAYYYINLLYNCLKKPLRAHRSDIKFFVIIITIFFVFWQTVCLNIFQTDILACFDKSAHSFQHHRIMRELEHILICIEMLIMAFVSAEAFSFENYMTNQRRTGSLHYIIKDVVMIFCKEMRLIKPRIVGFRQNFGEQTQLQTITRSIRNTSCATFECKMNSRIEDNTRQDYF